MYYKQRKALEAIKQFTDFFYKRHGGGYTLSKQSSDEEIRSFSNLTQDFMNCIRTQVYIGLDKD